MQDDTSLARLMARLSHELAAYEGEQATLEHITTMAVDMLGDNVMASISALHGGGRFETPASSDPIAVAADELQYALETGPCVVAAIDGHTTAIPDLTVDEKFPRWSAIASQEYGLRSVLSLQLSTARRRLGALNVYSDQTARFSPHDLAVAWAFATHAGICLRAAQQREELMAGMARRTVIGQATGVVMALRGMPPDEAFELLRKIANDNNVKVHDLAAKVVGTLEVPERGTDRR